jgi:hypothetical protein
MKWDTTLMVITPPTKSPIIMNAAAVAELPALTKYLFEVGIMLYKDVKSYVLSVSSCRTYGSVGKGQECMHTRTPALRLNAADKKALLCTILKLRTSTQITAAPRMQANSSC